MVHRADVLLAQDEKSLGIPKKLRFFPFPAFYVINSKNNLSLKGLVYCLPKLFYRKTNPPEI